MAAADGLIFTAWNPAQTGVSFSTFTLNETTDYYAVVFRAPHTDTIAKAFVNVASVSGTPTIEVSIQGVTSGVPDGTIKSSGNAKKQFTAAAGAAWQTLDATYTPTQGELLAVVVKLISGTSATINVRISGGAALFPVGITYDNATATKTLLGSPPIWGIKGAGTDWCHGNPISTAATTNVTTASVIESGAVFVSPSWSTLRLIGVRVLFRVNASSAAEIRVYSGNGAADTTVAQSISVDVSELYSSASVLFASFYFPAVTVSPSSGFRISVRTTAGTYVETANTFVDPEDAKAYGPLNGFAYRTRRTTGNWTDSTTTGVSLEPIFDDVTVSGGTTILNPGRRQIWTPRPAPRPAARPVIVRQTATTTAWLPISRTVVKTAQPVRTRAPARLTTVPVVVSSNVYVPILQARRLAVRERWTTRRAPAPLTLTTVTPGPSVIVPLTQPRRLAIQQRVVRRSPVLSVLQSLVPVPGPTNYFPLQRAVPKCLRPTVHVRRVATPAIVLQQSSPQTILISSPRIVR